MILGANQPYFLPYIGYFQLMRCVDVFILADDVQYEKGGWINRNRILRDGHTHYLTLPLVKHSHKRTIGDHRISENLSLILRSAESAYRKAPHFERVFPLLESIVGYEDRRLNHFLLHSLRTVNEYLEISTPLVLNSSRGEGSSLRGEERVVEMCSSMGADTYINAFGGQSLYRCERFAEDGISLKFIRSELRPYKQLRTQEFVPALSILDVMMNVSLDGIRDMLNAYTIFNS